MSLRPLAPGSQPRKWSNDRFSIISTITCSMPFEPRGDSAVAALAAVWDKNSAPVMAAPVEAPMSWRKVRRVSIRASMRSASERRQGPTDTHSCRIRLAVAAWFPPGCSPVSERCVVGERPAAFDEKEAVGYPRPRHDEERLAEQQCIGAGLDADQAVAADAGDVTGPVTAAAVAQESGSESGPCVGRPGLVHYRLGERHHAVSCYRRALLLANQWKTPLARRWLASLLGNLVSQPRWCDRPARGCGTGQEQGNAHRLLSQAADSVRAFPAR